MKDNNYDNIIKMASELIKISEEELKRLKESVENIINYKIEDEKIISLTFDNLLNLIFAPPEILKNTYYKLLDYTEKFNKELRDDYEKLFIEQFEKDNYFNPEEYGKIVCAALFYNDCIYMAHEGHHAIFPMEPMGVLRNAEQGFVTEYGFFVNRKDGLSIAKYYNQIEHKHNPLDELNSEDLKRENITITEKQKKYTYKLRKKP